MGRSYRQLIDEVARHVQDTSSGRETRIKDALNRQYEELAEGADWVDLWKFREGEVTAYAGENYVFMPSYVEQVKIAIADSNKDLIQFQSPAMLGNRFYDQLSTSANIFTLAPSGTSAIKRPISSAETLTFVSSDATDTTPVFEVWGLVSGEEINESVTLNGTSTVATSNSFDRITRIGTSSTDRDSSRIGNVTITGTTSSLEYAVIPSHSYDARYKMFKVLDAPSANDTLTIVYKKKVTPLINDGDTLEIPVDRALFEFAVMDIMDSQAKSSQAREHERKGEKYKAQALSQYSMQSQTVQQSFPQGPGSRGNDRYDLFNRRISVVS